jgi:predicted Zn-dependent protease
MGARVRGGDRMSQGAWLGIGVVALAGALAASAQTSTPSATAPAATTDASAKSSDAKSAQETDPAQDDKKPTPGAEPVTGDVAAPAKPAADKADAKDAKKEKPGTKPVADAKPVDPDKVVEVGSQPVKVKPGSADDVNAVGNRDIGGRGAWNWYSTNTEIKVGRSYADEIEKNTKLITDPVVVEYVNRIGQNIVKNSDCKVPFTIKVIDSDEINAMALPGGFFYVNSGLILNADEESELAGVMAHETAHVCAHHAMRQMTRANMAQIGMIPVMIFVGGWTGYGIYEGSQFAIPITFLKFSREFEAQADYLGVQYMYRAGYDPQSFITFFEKVQALEKRKPGLVSKAFSDHPQTPDRIEHSQEEIAHILPARDDYTVTTSEFDEIKARLARIENKRRLTDSKGKTRPSLRKASTGTDTTGSKKGSSTDDTDRPTLHKRDDAN